MRWFLLKKTTDFMRKYLGMAAIMLAAQSFFSCSDDKSVNNGADYGCIVAHIDSQAGSRTAVGDAVDGTNAVGIVWTDEILSAVPCLQPHPELSSDRKPWHKGQRKRKQTTNHRELS